MELSLPKRLSVIFLILSLISLSECQQKQHNELKLNETIKGEINKDDTYEYYKLVLPNDIQDQTKNLVFEVREDKDAIKQGEEIFSDPDMHISRYVLYPSRIDSEWYSERYGDDIISIGKENVSPNGIFYVGMYCQFKCKYKIKAYLSENILLDLSYVYNILLNKGATLNYYFNIPDQEYEEFSIIASSPYLNEFKFFVAKNSPSSQNTFNVTPSWAGGYVATIEKGGKDYCKGCEIHVLLKGNDYEDSTVQLYTYFQGKSTILNKGSPIYDFAKSKKQRCYSFEVDNYQQRYGSGLIIQTTLFSGHTALYVHGWKENLEDYSTIDKSSPYHFHVSNEKAIMLNKTDFANFDKESPQQSDSSRTLHFCVYATQISSYVISAHYLTEIETLQKYNFIFPSTEISGYMLKDQVTRYRVIEYGEKSTLDINIALNSGDINAYVFFCYQENCYFTNQLIEEKKNNKELISAEEVMDGYRFSIKTEDNKCHQLGLEQSKKLHCSPLVVIKCISENELCAFKLRVQTTTSTILMSPRTTYYNILPAKQTDAYEIIVEDSEINSVVIVLNTASGDAELLVYKVIEKDNSKELIGLSLNNDYIPDVVRLTPSKMNTTNLVGKYQVKIITKIFSAYHLYYYTTTPQKKETDYTDILNTINAGDLIYDIFPMEEEFKIYQYSPFILGDVPSEDIKISLKSVNLKFSFRVYLDLKTLEKNRKPSPGEDAYKGYQWRSGYNNELLIKTSDKDYSKKGPYYIVIVKDFDSSEFEPHTVATFYLDITTRSTPLQLIEGLEHATVLNEDYSTQSYWYTHYNMEMPFELNINIFNGMLNVYISLTSFNLQDLKNFGFKDKLVKYAEYIHSSTVLSLSPDEMKKVCDGDTCSFFIFVQRASPMYDADYLIVGKTISSKMELLTPGLVKQGQVKKGDCVFYYVEEMTRRDATSIMVHFEGGTGDVYVRIPATPEKGENINLPSERNFDYKGSYTYMGNYVQIPASVYNSLSERNPKIQIQIGIYINSVAFESEENQLVSYKISYSSEPRKISQNEPWNGFIVAGEAQYFQLYFEYGTQNIYASLSNMNGGDADLYINYGIDPLPTTGKADWISANPGHEFITIKKTDSVFEKKKIREMGGLYSILVIGYTNTSFTLFVSSGENVIFPIMDNSPITCKCDNPDDKCYFNYDNFDMIYNSHFGESSKKNFDILFATDYLYGKGQLFAKLIDSAKFYEMKNVIDAFPDEKEHTKIDDDLINSNIIKLNIQKDNTAYNANSLLLLTLQCRERSLVDVTAATGAIGDTFRLDENRNNIFYFSDANAEKYLLFYNYVPSELVYELEAYSGDADVIVYVNKTMYDTETQTTNYKYTHLASFRIGKNTGFEYEQTTSEELYQNSIKTSENVFNENIVFKVIPTIPTAIKLKINYSRKWINVPVNIPKNFLSKSTGVLGYFDVQPDYSSVEFSIVLDEKVGKRAEVYIKYHTLTKNTTEISNNTSEESAYNYVIPDSRNFNYRIRTDKVLGRDAIVLDKFPKITQGKVLRVLFSVKVFKYSSAEVDEDENEFNTEEISMDTPFKITITPSIGGESSLYTTQKVYHSTIDTFSPLLNKTKTFYLSTDSEQDDTIVIELSSCSGHYSYSIREIVDGKPTNTRVKFSRTKEGGREIITLQELKQRNYEVKVFPTNDIPLCKLEKNYHLAICNNQVSYLFYYYSTTAENYKYSMIQASFTYETYGRGGIKIHVPRLKETDAFGNERDINDMHFDVFITEKQSEFDNMESVCYLSKMSKNQYSKKLYKNIKMKKGKIYIKGLKSGATYYLNLLAENPKTKELITFKPLQVISGTFFSNMSGWVIALAIIIVIILVGLVVYFYKRFKTTEAVLKYEENDLNRMARVPRSEAEMANMSNSQEKVKYSTLTADSERI